MKELKSGAKLLKHQGVINRLSATNTGAAPAAGIADCIIGDIIKAMWAGKGKQMSATVQKVGADSITVNWHDGTSSHRTFPKARAFKDGQPCAGEPLLSSLSLGLRVLLQLSHKLSHLSYHPALPPTLSYQRSHQLSKA